MRRAIEYINSLEGMAEFNFWLPIYVSWTAIVVPVVIETAKRIA